LAVLSAPDVPYLSAVLVFILALVVAEPRVGSRSLPAASVGEDEAWRSEVAVIVLPLWVVVL